MTNSMFPGRPFYVGPQAGIFGLLHHDMLVETSHDVMERVSYVKRNKPAGEIPVRLKNMIYLGDLGAAIEYRKLDMELNKAFDKARNDYLSGKRYFWIKSISWEGHQKILGDLSTEYMVRRRKLRGQIFDYIKSNLPECEAEWKSVGFPPIPTLTF